MIFSGIEGVGSDYDLDLSSPRIDDVKYSRRDGCSVFRVEVRMSVEKLQPWVILKQFSDERLQVVLKYDGRDALFR